MRRISAGSAARKHGVRTSRCARPVPPGPVSAVPAGALMRRRIPLSALVPAAGCISTSPHRCGRPDGDTDNEHHHIT